ncbi:MAG: DUF2892 domain-containing protein [Chloroflexales bacterium]
MKHLFNVGLIDRAIRLLLSVFLFMLAFGLLSGIGQIIAGVLGAVMLLTATVGVCPLYAIVGFATTGADAPAARR